ncbi:reverse transcriptase domain-containing protein [Tanacetum coccineum]
MKYHPQTHIPLRPNLGVLQIGIKSQDFVMSDSEDSTVTYTEVSSPFEDLSDIGSPGVDGLPMMPEDPYWDVAEDSTITYTVVSSPFEGLSDIGSPRVDGPPVMPEDPYAYMAAAFQAPPSPNYDKEDEEDPEEDLIDYPADEGDDDDNDDESSDDDEDDDDVVDEDEDEEVEEEHPTLADSVPPPVHRVTARMSIRDESPTPFWPEAEIARLLAIPSPPPSPLSPCPTYPLGFRAAMIQQRDESPSTSHSLPLPPPIILSHTRASMAMMRVVASSTYILASRSETPPSGTPPLLPILLPTSSPPLLLPSTDRRADRPKVCLPPWKRLCIALGPRYKVGESSSSPTARPTGGFRADYGFVSTLDDEIRRDPERDDTDEIYGRLDEAHDARAVLSDRLNLLQRDRRSPCLHCFTHGERGQTFPLASSRPRSTGIACEVTETDEYIADIANPAATTSTTSVTNAQLKEMIDQGVTDALAARDADRNTNDDDSHNSGTGARKELTVGHDVAYAMTWTDLKKKMTDKYYPRGEIKKLEAELWNLKVKGTNVIGYNQCFQKLALLCVRMFPEESDKIERYTDGLTDMIHGSVLASRPNTMQEVIEIATELMDKKIRTFVERQSENKRKQDDNQQQQQQNKRQNTGRAYTVGTGEKKPYGGSKPICVKCNYHHDGPCAPKCHKCNRVGHLAHDCRSPTNTNASNNQRGTGAG